MVDSPLITSVHRQLEKAETLSDCMEAVNAEMSVKRGIKYDDSLSDDTSNIVYNPYLTDKEYEDARWWAEYADHDVFLLHGALGSGKGTHGNRISKCFNWYYGKNVILDYRPRELFDLQYVPSYCDLAHGNPHDPILLQHTDYVYFDKSSFIEQLSRMADVSLGGLANDADPNLEKLEKSKVEEIRRLSGVWLTQTGLVFFQNGVLTIDEIKRYHHKRNSNNPFGRMLILLYDLLRHAHLCVVAMTAYYDELDPLEFLPKVTVEIKCHKSEYNQHTVMGDMYKVNWMDSKQTRSFKKLRQLVVDGREPWALLGNYVHTEILQDIGKGALNTSTGIRTTDIIMLKDTEGFRDEKGVAWIENEYIGYALRTDKDGWTYERGQRYQKLGVPNALIGVVRRLNWRNNKCEPAEHKKGAAVFTAPGVFDIYNSWSAFGLPIPKSMTK
jgi:hypothetical protein